MEEKFQLCMYQLLFRVQLQRYRCLVCLFKYLVEHWRIPCVLKRGMAMSSIYQVENIFSLLPSCILFFISDLSSYVRII